MTRSSELVTALGKKSRLTVTPTRVTVKVSRDLRDRAEEIYRLALSIAEDIDPDVSMRGVFDFKNNQIRMHTGRHLSVQTAITFPFADR